MKGLQFGVDIIYEVEAGKEGEIEEDIEVIAEAMRMLQYDYLGGSVQEDMEKLNSTILRQIM